LRDHAREFLGSPLAKRLRALPFVQNWLASNRARGFREAKRTLEQVVGEKFETIRDDLLGDAVVLTLRVPPGGKPDDARGLLLVRIRNRGLLDRMIQGVNTAQTQSGEIARVVDKTRAAETYHVREYAGGAKPPEYYAAFDDNTFAWSNSEELVQGVIDRKSGLQKGLGHDKRFLRVRDRLPRRAAVSLFIDPRVVEAILAAAPKAKTPEESRFAAGLTSYVGAVEYAGAALEWREGFILHVEEFIDPEKVAPWARRWLERPAGTPALDRVPATALAVASAHVDFVAVEEMIRDIIPARDRGKLDTILLCLTGLCLGQDMKSAILTRLGPAVLAYVDVAPDADSRSRASLILTIDLDGGTGISAAVENAVRTALAFYTLDPKHGGGQLQVETTETAAGRVVAFRENSPIAFGVARDRLAIGKSAQAVTRALERPTASAPGFARLRREQFPDVESFVCADLRAIHEFADQRRDAIARKIAARHRTTVEDAARDLDSALALISLFQDGFVTSRIDLSARSAHRMIGLLGAKNAASAR
jgi:hypothetical protein